MESKILLIPSLKCNCLLRPTLWAGTWCSWAESDCPAFCTETKLYRRSYLRRCDDTSSNHFQRHVSCLLRSAESAPPLLTSIRCGRAFSLFFFTVLTQIYQGSLGCECFSPWLGAWFVVDSWKRYFLTVLDGGPRWRPIMIAMEKKAVVLTRNCMENTPEQTGSTFIRPVDRRPIYTLRKTSIRIRKGRRRRSNHVTCHLFTLCVMLTRSHSFFHHYLQCRHSPSPQFCMCNGGQAAQSHHQWTFCYSPGRHGSTQSFYTLLLIRKDS